MDKTLEIMRKQRVHYHAAARAAQPGDQVTIDFRGTIDGAEFQGSSAKDQPVVLGEGRLLPDFEANVAGLKAKLARPSKGGKKVVLLNFPNNPSGYTPTDSEAKAIVAAAATPRAPVTGRCGCTCAVIG